MENAKSHMASIETDLVEAINISVSNWLIVKVFPPF